MRPALARLRWSALGAVALWACSDVEREPLGAGGSSEGGAGGEAGAGGAPVRPPSPCTEFMTRLDCCAHGPSWDEVLRCNWLKPNPVDGFPGACFSMPTEDCTNPDNPCPAGKHCYTADGNCGTPIDPITRGVCIDD